MNASLRRTGSLLALLGVAVFTAGATPAPEAPPGPRAPDEAIAASSDAFGVVQGAASDAVPGAAPRYEGPWTLTEAVPFVGDRRAVSQWPLYVQVMLYVLYVIIGLIGLYTVRHYWFTMNRLFGRQRHPYATLDALDWPEVTVLVPCHNEEAVVAHILDALLAADYPADRLRIMPVNDRSDDRTMAIVEQYVRRYPGRVTPLHRLSGKPGKAAALNEAARLTTTEVVLVFDADYVPGGDLIKQLAAPFTDPEVGAVMGRVVPMNASRNLLTRLLDLERTGGYQVDQQARMNMRLVPQYGGTVGGIRQSALRSLGGWHDDSLTEDTDITCRLIAGGWKIAYSNRFECYEEVPETWPVRIRQIMRWARGHTDAALQHSTRIARARALRPAERLDGLLLLGVYMMSPLLLLGWFLTIALFYLGVHSLHGVVAVLAVASYNTIGNFAVFFEIATAARLDGSRERIRLLPLNILGFLVSMVSVSRAVLTQLVPSLRGRGLVWDKTERFRPPHPAR